MVALSKATGHLITRELRSKPAVVQVSKSALEFYSQTGKFRPISGLAGAG